MLNSNIPIFLASKSPRRRILLKQIGLNFKSFRVELEEEVLDGEHPIKTVKRLSQEKLALAEKRIKNGVIETETERAFLLLVKVGFQGATDDFEHELENVISKAEVDESGRNNFIVFKPLRLNLTVPEPLHSSRSKFTLEKRIEEFDQIQVFVHHLGNQPITIN